MTRWEGAVVTATERLTLRTFREDDLPLYAAVDHRSMAVMERLGMTYDHEADLDEHGDRFHAVVHAITRERWIDHTGR